MTSIARQMRRKRGVGVGAAKPQQIVYLPNGGYAVLHPTKGWRFVSPRRVAHYIRGTR